MRLPYQPSNFRLWESVFEEQGDEQAERIAELERLAGKQALELEILKKAGSLLDTGRRRNGK
jgi:hypothetical protein